MSTRQKAHSGRCRVAADERRRRCGRSIPPISPALSMRPRALHEVNAIVTVLGIVVLLMALALPRARESLRRGGRAIPGEDIRVGRPGRARHKRAATSTEFVHRPPSVPVSWSRPGMLLVSLSSCDGLGFSCPSPLVIFPSCSSGLATWPGWRSVKISS